jgi:hypothetical protein
MTYSNAYFAEPEMDLHAAQIAKYELLCRKLRLTSHDHMLEIGSGREGFAIHAARKYGCRITTVTISKQQYEYAHAAFIESNSINDHDKPCRSDSTSLGCNLVRHCSKVNSRGSNWIPRRSSPFHAFSKDRRKIRFEHWI